MTSPAAKVLAAGAAVTALCGAGAATASAAVTAVQNGDTVTVEGDAAPNDIRIVRDAANADLIKVHVDGGAAPIGVFAKPAFTKLVVRGNAGADRVVLDTSAGPFAADEQVTISGGPGDDELIGGDGAQTIEGQDGDDLIDGDAGADVLRGGPGSDVIRWDPGDGNDVVDGDAGIDAMLFNGADATEAFEAAPAAGGRVRFTRSVGPITMDVGGTEVLVLDMKGGADSYTGAPDLAAATELREAWIIGKPDGDGNDNRIIGGDTVDVVRAGAGADQISGGAGPDDLRGEAGDDRIDGGAGIDRIDGGAGADVLACGGDGDLVVSDAADTVAPDCLPAPAPPAGGGLQQPAPQVLAPPRAPAPARGGAGPAPRRAAPDLRCRPRDPRRPADHRPQRRVERDAAADRRERADRGTPVPLHGQAPTASPPAAARP
jgi:hypothetical protein